MNNRYLNQLCRRVLGEIPGGISKVRFAKVLYFTHKYLVQAGLSTTQQMEFIRMPLGPVPVGFMELTDANIKIEELRSPELSYDKQVYKLDTKLNWDDSVQNTVRACLEILGKLQTSILVEISHREPSWLGHANGQYYCLTAEDLKIPLLRSDKSQISPALDGQRLQARLVEGMLDEIVEDSTSLEYPNLKKG